jgi:hypothetical protein
VKHLIAATSAPDTWAAVLEDEAANVTAAVRAETMALQQDLRLQTLGAGLGQRLANAWRSRVYPKNGDSLDAAGYVKTKAGKIIDAFDRGVIIRARAGRWLAIPTDAAGAERITPLEWQRRTGLNLRFVPLRGGRAAILVLDNARLSKTGLARALPDRSKRRDPNRLRGQASVVVFTLARAVRLEKRLDLQLSADTAAARLQARIGSGAAVVSLGRYHPDRFLVAGG